MKHFNFTVTLNEKQTAKLEALDATNNKPNPDINWPDCDLCDGKCTSHPHHLTLGENRHVHLCGNCWGRSVTIG